MVKDMTGNRESLAAWQVWLHRRSGGLDGAGSRVPFRDAHVTGALVAMAEARGVDLPDLTLEDMKSP